MHADNSAHLIAARRRSEQTPARAETALAELNDTGQPITIAAVAALGLTPDGGRRVRRLLPSDGGALRTVPG